MSLAGLTVGVVISAVDRFSAPVRQIQGSTSKLGQALESITTKAAMAGAALSGVAMATSGLSSRMQAIGMQAVHAFASFDDARAVIASMPGVTNEALKQIEASAFAFTRKNRATLADYYNTTYNILSAGIPEALAAYATEVSIKVGQATRGSADQAGEAVAILWNNMRDGSREAAAEFARMGDIITATQQRFQLKNLTQLTEGLKYATPAAKTARLAVDDMSAAVGRLNSAGLQGSMAGTALANMLANRFKAAREIGFKVAVKKGTGELDLLRTLENLKAAVGDINRLTPEMEAKLRKGFGDEGFRAVMLLLHQTDALKEDLAAIRGSAGAFERASAIINDSAGAKWQQMLNRMEQLWIRLGQALNPLKDWIAGYVMKAVDALDALIERFPRITAGAVGVLAALSGVAAAAGTALVAIAAIGKLRGIKALIGGFFGRGGHGPGEGSQAGGLLDTVTGGIQKVWVVNMPGGGLGGGLPGAGGKPGGAGGKTAGAARTLGGRLRSMVAGVAMQASLAWQAIVAWGGKAWAVIARIGAALAPLASKVWAVVSPIGKLAAAFAAGYAVGTLLSKGIDALLSKIMGFETSLGSVIYDIVQAVKALPAQMMAFGGQIIDGLLAGIRQRWDALKEGVTGMGSAISGWFKDKLGIRSPSRVFAEMGGHLMTGLQQGIQRAADLPLAAMGAVAGALAAPMTAGAITLGVSAAPTLAANEPIRVPAPMVAAPEPIRVPAPMVAAPEPIRVPAPMVAAPEPIRMPQPLVAAPEPIRVPAPMVAAPEPIRMPQPLVAAPEPIRVPAPMVAAPEPARAPRSAPGAPAMPSAAPIHITVNLNGPATPEAAQDVAAAVRREVERLLSERDRRAAIARRAAMLDGGLA